MDIKITSDLKLTFPIRYVEKSGDNAETEFVPTVWAYHSPISREVFEANWRIISATSSTLLKRGVSPAVSRIATLALKDAGRADAEEYGLPEGCSMDDGGAAQPFLRELRRLTLVLAPGPGGYEMVPVEVALGRGTIDAEDWTEAESSLVFFTCGYSIATKQKRATSAVLLASVLSGSITSLSPSEYASSLNGSMRVPTFEPIATGVASLVPS